MNVLDYAEKNIRAMLDHITSAYEDRYRNMLPPQSATEAQLRQQFLFDSQKPYIDMLAEIDKLRLEPKVIAVRSYTFPEDLQHPRIFVGSIMQDCVLYEALSDLAAEGKHTVEVTVAVRGLE